MTTEVTKREGNEAVAAASVWDVQPRTFTEALQLCEVLAQSTMVPEQYVGKPGDILIAIQYGAELGVKPLQAIQGIAVINRRPTIWGDLALAVVLNSGKVEEIREMTTEEIRAAGKATFYGKRKGRAEPIVREFSLEDAKKANLIGNDKKPIWRQYPERMLMMRARSWGLRDGWSDVLKGMSIREEVQDFDDEPKPPPPADDRVAELKARLTEAKERAQNRAAPKSAPADPPQDAKAQAPPAAEPNGDLVSQAQIKRFFAICSTSKIPHDEIRKRIAEYRYTSTSQIKRIHYDALCDWAEKYMPTNPDYGTKDATDSRFE